LGTENHRDQGIQGLGIDVDEAFFGKLLAYEHESIQQSHVEDTKKEKKKGLHSRLVPKRKIIKKALVMMKI